jgi:hypothetical protein
LSSSTLSGNCPLGNLVGVRKEAESTRFTDSTDPVTELSLESGVLVGMQG